MEELNNPIESVPHNEWDAIVNSTIRRFVPICARDNILSIDDLRQEAWIGILSARQKYDHTRGTKFVSYAISWINWHILRLIDHKLKLRKKPRWVSEEIIDDEQWYVNENNNEEVMDTAIEYLSDQKHIDMFIDHFVKGETFQSIGKRYDLSRQRVHMIVTNMVSTLKLKMNNENAEDSCTY